MQQDQTGSLEKTALGYRLTPMSAESKHKKGTASLSSVLPLRTGRAVSWSLLGAIATLCLEAPLSCEMSPAPAPAQACSSPEAHQGLCLPLPKEVTYILP